MTEVERIQVRLSEIRSETIALSNEEKDLIEKLGTLDIDFRTKFALWFYSDQDEDVLGYYPDSDAVRDMYQPNSYSRKTIIDFTGHYGEDLCYILDYNEEEVEELISKGELTSHEYSTWLNIAMDMYKEKFKKFTIDW